MARKLPVPDEHHEQAAVFEWLLRVAIIDEPLIHPLVFSPPNGTKLAGTIGQRIGQANKLKREGMCPGASDILCLIPRHGYNALAIEMKKRGRQNEKENGVITGGVSQAQREFLEAVRKAGGYDAVCYGADEAKEIFKWYLNIRQDL